MKFQKDQIVKFKPEKDPNRFVEGKIISIVEVRNEIFYWVETMGAIIPDPSPYSEEQLLEWNQEHDGKCTCGAKKLNHPAHSSWCDSLNNPGDKYKYFPWPT